MIPVYELCTRCDGDMQEIYKTTSGARLCKDCHDHYLDVVLVFDSSFYTEFWHLSKDPNKKKIGTYLKEKKAHHKPNKAE